MITCSVCGHVNNSSRVTCENCGSDLSDNQDWRNTYDVEAHLTKMEKIFDYQKSLILRRCHDWERDSVENIIFEIEGLQFVEKWDTLLITSRYDDGFICEASKGHLFELLKMRDSICKDVQAIKENSKTE